MLSIGTGNKGAMSAPVLGRSGCQLGGLGKAGSHYAEVLRGQLIMSDFILG